MNAKVNTQIKKWLSRTVPDSPKLRYLAYLPTIETFRKNHTEEYSVFEDRYRMYDYINSAVLGHSAIDYLEFGVFEGASIKYWAELNSDSQSSFYGFDTFSGLPEDWESFTGSCAERAFDVNGQYPQLEDKRVAFVEGLFQETLPNFLENYRYRHQLVIHNDSDLYSATLYVLTYANSIIVPGTIIIFDEFSSALSEIRALNDYCAAYLRTFEVVAATVSATDYYSQIAIRMM